ncbi:MAG: hypothetical protein OXH26_03330, partial [bacterium]|nr:hypothetical protein [bacterium]
LATDCLAFESGEDVTRSVLRYAQGGPGFSEFMILASATRAGAVSLHTFDTRLAPIEGATLVPAGPS